LKTIFDLCEPRNDVVKGDIAKSDFAADLAQVIKGTASDEYRTPEPFFRNTYPTRGLKSLLANVCARLSGKAGRGRGMPPAILTTRHPRPVTVRHGASPP
jgi:predicted AAA+ superfamily ATPase